MEKNIELEEYVLKFNKYPFLPTMANYDNPIFKFLMSMAVDRNKPLTEDEINEAFKNEVDLIDDDFDPDEEDDYE